MVQQLINVVCSCDARMYGTDLIVATSFSLLAGFIFERGAGISLSNWLTL